MRSELKSENNIGRKLWSNNRSYIKKKPQRSLNVK